MERSSSLVTDEELQKGFMTFGNFVFTEEPNGYYHHAVTGIENPSSRIENPSARIENPSSRIENPSARIENPSSRIENPSSSLAAVAQTNNPSSAVASASAALESSNLSPWSDLFALPRAAVEEFEMPRIRGSSVYQPYINLGGSLNSMERKSAFGNQSWGLGMYCSPYNVAEESQTQAENWQSIPPLFSFLFNRSQKINQLPSQDYQFTKDYNRCMNIGSPYPVTGSYQYPQLKESVIEERVQKLVKSLPFLLDEEEETNTRFLNELIEKCQDRHYDSIVEKIVSNQESFLRAVTGVRTGRSNVICKLIKMLKRSKGAFVITEILAPHFIFVTRNYNLRKVIKECLTTFGNCPNAVLYDEAIRNVKEICIHKEGSKLFQDCIFGRIGGQKRIDLLHAIADTSDLLSYDPFGNYVVTHVLSLRREDVNAMIYSKLEKEYVSLAQQESGSHVIERCISSSEAGLLSFLKQIINSPDVLPILAKNRYGNYVIQTAARKCEEHGLDHLLKVLIQFVKPYERKFMRHHYGKHVVETLRNLDLATEVRLVEHAGSRVVVS